MPSPTRRQTKPLQKHLFITTGATAPFTALIEASLGPSFLNALLSHDFTHLTVQCGTALPRFNVLKESIKDKKNYGIEIQGFDFNKMGLGSEMLRCQSKEGSRLDGIVVSHAGTGSILDAMRLGLRLIVVPNTALLDNHQEDLAFELERQGYVVKSDIPSLPEAISRSIASVPKDSAHLRPASIAPFIDEVVGYEQDTRARLD